MEESNIARHACLVWAGEKPEARMEQDEQFKSGVGLIIDNADILIQLALAVDLASFTQHGTGNPYSKGTNGKTIALSGR